MEENRKIFLTWPTNNFLSERDRKVAKKNSQTFRDPNEISFSCRCCYQLNRIKNKKTKKGNLSKSEKKSKKNQ